VAHHKRKGPKSTRSGCLLCKPHKHQAVKGTGVNVRCRDRAAQVSESEWLADPDGELDDFLATEGEAAYEEIRRRTLFDPIEAERIHNIEKRQMEQTRAWLCEFRGSRP